jgi:hypothetical protein
MSASPFPWIGESARRMGRRSSSTAPIARPCGAVLLAGRPLGIAARWRPVPADQVGRRGGRASPEQQNCSPVRPGGAAMTILVDDYLAVGNPGVSRTGRRFAGASIHRRSEGHPSPDLPTPVPAAWTFDYPALLRTSN